MSNDLEKLEKERNIFLEVVVGAIAAVGAITGGIMYRKNKNQKDNEIDDSRG